MARFGRQLVLGRAPLKPALVDPPALVAVPPPPPPRERQKPGPKPKPLPKQATDGTIGQTGKTFAEIKKDHERAIWQMARKFSINNEELYEELIQEGMIALVHAAKKWTPTGGANLNTYALYWMRACMHRYLKTFHNGIVRLPVYRPENKFRSHMSLNQPIFEDSDEEPINMIADTNFLPDEAVDRAKTSLEVRAKLKAVEPSVREKFGPIGVDLLWNRLCTHEPAKLEEIGARHHSNKNKRSPLRRGPGVSRQRVDQIEKELFKFLRTYLADFV